MFPESCTELWLLIDQKSLSLVVPRLLKLIEGQLEIKEPRDRNYLPGLRLALKIIADVALI